MAQGGKRKYAAKPRVRSTRLSHTNTTPPPPHHPRPPPPPLQLQAAAAAAAAAAANTEREGGLRRRRGEIESVSKWYIINLSAKKKSSVLNQFIILAAVYSTHPSVHCTRCVFISIFSLGTTVRNESVKSAADGCPVLIFLVELELLFDAFFQLFKSSKTNLVVVMLA